VQLTEDPLAGFWRGAEWILCTDGKARPVERATQSYLIKMDAGTSASLGLVRFTGGSEGQNEEVVIYNPLIANGKSRAGRLRGYGNALCAPQAEAFARVMMECLSC
jgi:DNA (cytosine-5)-methyltransferase 1